MIIKLYEYATLIYEELPELESVTIKEDNPDVVGSGKVFGLVAKDLVTSSSSIFDGVEKINLVILDVSVTGLEGGKFGFFLDEYSVIVFEVDDVVTGSLLFVTKMEDFDVGEIVDVCVLLVILALTVVTVAVSGSVDIVLFSVLEVIFEVVLSEIVGDCSFHEVFGKFIDVGFVFFEILVCVVGAVREK